MQTCSMSESHTVDYTLIFVNYVILPIIATVTCIAISLYLIVHCTKIAGIGAKRVTYGHYITSIIFYLNIVLFRSNIIINWNFETNAGIVIFGNTIMPFCFSLVQIFCCFGYSYAQQLHTHFKWLFYVEVIVILNLCIGTVVQIILFASNPSVVIIFYTTDTNADYIYQVSGIDAPESVSVLIVITLVTILLYITICVMKVYCICKGYMYHTRQMSDLFIIVIGINMLGYILLSQNWEDGRWVTTVSIMIYNFVMYPMMVIAPFNKGERQSLQKHHLATDQTPTVTQEVSMEKEQTNCIE
eukprot:333379_1